MQNDIIEPFNKKNMKKLVLLALLIPLMWSCEKNENNPVLTIEGGQIQGVKAENPDVYVYKGIPYAAAPIGSLRR